ncbi:Tim44/TimA family putative adaptor protein [Nostoc sp. NIES-2111]
MQDTFDLTTIIFLALAVIVIWRLRSVLGTRTGSERPPGELPRRPVPPASPRPADNNVVRLPEKTEAPAEDTPPTDRWKGVTEEGTPLAAGFDAVHAADPTFDPKEFREGAKQAYEMIVTAFAQGDRRTLRDLLSREVFDGFVGAINDREKRGERVEMTFVSIEKAEFADAQMKGKSAQITMRFLSKLITATYDKSGGVVDGAADKVVDVTDVWTFSRDTSSRDPNWKLIATESGH